MLLSNFRLVVAQMMYGLNHQPLDCHSLLRLKITIKKFKKRLYLQENQNIIYQIFSIGTQRFVVIVVSVTPPPNTVARLDRQTIN